MEVAARDDLLVVAADSDQRAVLEAILARHQALGIRPIGFRVVVHPHHDPGVRVAGASLARSLRDAYGACLVVLDHQGSGSPATPVEFEAELDAALAPEWGDRGRAVVLDPEIEEWLVGAGPALRMEQELDPRSLWASRFGIADGAKPPDPKAALHTWLRHIGEKPVSSVYRLIAERASLRRGCAGRSWPRFRAALRAWFPTSEPHPTARTR